MFSFDHGLGGELGFVVGVGHVLHADDRDVDHVLDPFLAAHGEEAAGADDVGRLELRELGCGVDDGVHPGHGFDEPGAGGEVALDRVNVSFRMAAEDARPMTGVAQQGDDVASERARSAGDEDVHGVATSWPKRRRACRSRKLGASAGSAGPLRSGPLSPSR